MWIELNLSKLEFWTLLITRNKQVLKEITSDGKGTHLIAAVSKGWGPWPSTLVVERISCKGTYRNVRSPPKVFGRGSRTPTSSDTSPRSILLLSRWEDRISDLNTSSLSLPWCRPRCPLGSEQRVWFWSTYWGQTQGNGADSCPHERILRSWCNKRGRKRSTGEFFPWHWVCWMRGCWCISSCLRLFLSHWVLPSPFGSSAWNGLLSACWMASRREVADWSLWILCN